MMFGLGTTAPTGTGTTAVAIPGFTDGLKMWTDPGVAVSTLGAAVKNPGSALSGPLAPFTFGLLAVPLGIVAVVFAMSEGGKH